MTTTISPVNAQKVWVFSANGDGTLSPTTFGGGGSGTVTSIATTTPITGGPITTTGTIACATCTTNAAALTNGNVVSGAGGQAAQASSIATSTLVTSAAALTNNALVIGAGSQGTQTLAGFVTDGTAQLQLGGTTTSVGSVRLNGSSSGGATMTVTSTGTGINFSSNMSCAAANVSSLVNTGNGAASFSPTSITGTAFAGTGTTSFPLLYLNCSGASAPTTLNTNGTSIGVNACSGFTGNLLDLRVNGGTAVAQIDINGRLSISSIKVVNLLLNNTAASISSGFGSGASIVHNNGPAAFSLNVGTGGVATSGVVGLPTASNGWVCNATDQTTPGVNATKQSGSTGSSATFTNYNTTTGSAAAWNASDVLFISCLGF